jgi:RNA polymerase sigma-70 factor (ECF subfamily)
MTKFWRNNGENNFSDIYDKYIDKIYRFVFLKVNSEPIAQDITSETFTRTLEYINNSGNNVIENTQAFLYRTASNAVIDYYRQKSRQNVPLNEFHVSDAGGATPEQKAQIVMIKDALQKLEGEHADIVMWHYVEDLSIKEIAEILDRPENTIRVMLHRGLKELRRYFV